MRLCAAFLSCILISSGTSLYAQIPDQDNGSATDMIEVLVEDQEDSEYGYDTFLEQLDYYRKNPLDLNKADYNELRQSGLFTELQIRDLQNHIQYFGPLSSILELQTIPSFNINDIYQIDYYADVSASDQNALSWLEKLTAGDYAYYLRSTRVLEEQAGYTDEDGNNSNIYLGSNYRVYTRLKYIYKNQISYGFTAEKDPGEPFKAPAYFDYWSGHYFQRSSGWLRALALGDYELRIGQGLIAWSGFGMSKSIYPITIKRSGATLSPYSSVDENRFFRGAAATFGKGKTELTLFGSYNQVDANRVEIEDTTASDVSDEGFVTISALQLSGLHRSESEIEDKDAIRFLSAGANLAYNGPRFSIAGAGILYEFDAVLKEDRSPYELYDFEGSRLVNGSLSYSYFLRNMLLFGETAISNNGKAGTLNGLIIPVDRHIDFAIVQRYFDPGFQTFFSQTFSENSFPRNEKGMYAGLEVTPSKPWKINAYIDMYEAPWLESSTDAPGYGVDYLGTVYYKPNRNFETYLRIRHEISDRNADELLQGDLQHDIITDEAKTRIRWNLSYKITREVTLRNRVEYSRYDENLTTPEFGYMLYQDVVYKPWEKPFSIAARYSVFQTDSYNTRIYAYENDILYAYSIANLSGAGQRYYMVLQYSPISWIDTWIKIVRTTYADREEIGSGNELITGNNRTELRLQLRFKW